MDLHLQVQLEQKLVLLEQLLILCLMQSSRSHAILSKLAHACVRGLGCLNLVCPEVGQSGKVPSHSQPWILTSVAH